MARNRIVRVQQLVDGLVALESDYITRDRVAEYIADLRVEDSSLERHVGYRDDRYTRNLIYRDDWFEVMTICWQPGQQTPIHTHNGQLGWMTVERGGLIVNNYQHLTCDAADNQNVAGVDCLAGGNDVQLDPIASLGFEEGGEVGLVDKQQTIHSIACPADAGEPAVSLHIYSKPFPSCVIFDLEAKSCRRRELFWDSEYGEPLPPA